MIRKARFFSLRSFGKENSIAFLGIFGLSLGIWISLMVMLWGSNELGWNRFHDNSETIYQVMSNVQVDKGNRVTWEGSGYPVGKYLSQHVPGVEAVVRVSKPQMMMVGRNDKSFPIQILGVDPNFFDVFTFPLLAGTFDKSPGTIKSVVLSEELAKSYFGDAPAIGGTLILPIGGREENYRVTGIFKAVPTKSSLQFDALIPLDNLLPHYNQGWGNAWTKTFVQLKAGASLEEVNGLIKNLPTTYGKEDWFTLFLYPFKGFHPDTIFKNGIPVVSYTMDVMSFGVIALLLWLLACLNYTGFNTSASMDRAKSIGLRKLLGSGRKRLIFKFLGETTVQVLMAMFFALLLAECTMPLFKNLTSSEMTIDLYEPELYMFLVGIGLATVLLSGVYPAILLSSFHPVKTLRDVVQTGAFQMTLRRGLLTVQVGTCIVLIAGITSVYLQLDHVQNKDLGFDTKKMMYVPIDTVNGEFSDCIFQIVKGSNLFEAVGRANIDFSSGTIMSSDPYWEGRKDSNGRPLFAIVDMDWDMLGLMGVPLIEGRYFSRSQSMDGINYILNQTAADLMGFENPLQQKLQFWGDTGGRIIGVVQDFHFNSMYQPIQPMIIRCRPSLAGNLFVLVGPEKRQEALIYLEKVYRRLHRTPFRYHFLDNTIKQPYSMEQKMGKLGAICSLMAIITLCLGIHGLTTHVAYERKREIALRKVMGASRISLFFFLSKDVLKSVILAMLLAIPLGSYFILGWKQRFTFYICKDVWIFVVTVSVILLVVFSIISSQSIRMMHIKLGPQLREE